MSRDWTEEIEVINDAAPKWTADLVPLCSTRCRWFGDDDACAITGESPSSICEPSVITMAELLCHRTP